VLVSQGRSKRSSRNISTFAMRSIPSGLAADLAAGTMTLCWCWRVYRRDGVEYGFTDHNRPLAFFSECNKTDCR